MIDFSPSPTVFLLKLNEAGRKFRMVGIGHLAILQMKVPLFFSDFFYRWSVFVFPVPSDRLSLAKTDTLYFQSTFFHRLLQDEKT